MKRFSFVFTVVVIMAGCGSGNGTEAGAANGNDSVSTAPVTDPSYDPRVQTDSGAKQMNLDSTSFKDSAE